MNPDSAISPAGRGRPAPSPSAYVITAPCENPPSTVRSGGIAASAATSSSHDDAREGLGERLGIRVADLLHGVPVGASRRQVERTAWRHAEHSPLRIEQIEEREEVALVRAATVEEHEQALRRCRGRADQVLEGVRGHVPPDVSCLSAQEVPLGDQALELGLIPAVHEVRMRAEAA